MIKKSIISFEEITEPNIKYYLENTDNWVSIELSNYGESYDEYSIAYRLYWYQNRIYRPANDYLIKTWKTFNGARRYILRELI